MNLAAPSFTRKILSLVLVLALSLSPASATPKGVQAIGLCAWSATDAQSLADTLVQADQDVQVSFLNHRFTPTTPGNRYANIDLIAKCFLTNTTHTFTAAIYFRYFTHHIPGAHFWDAFATSIPRKDEGAQSEWSNWKTSCDGFALWAKSMQSWITEKSIDSGRLKLVIIPILEDPESNYTRYKKMIAKTCTLLRKSGVTNVQFRRSVIFGAESTADTQKQLLKDTRSIGALSQHVTIELHGSMNIVKLLKKGDAYSNDGNLVYFDREPINETNNYYTDNVTRPENAIPLSKFNALSTQATVLLWRPAYNGLMRSPESGVGPSFAERLNIQPFEGDADTHERPALRVFLGLNPTAK